MTQGILTKDESYAIQGGNFRGVTRNGLRFS